MYLYYIEIKLIFEKYYRVFAENEERTEAERVHIVVSISPQTTLSIAKKFSISPESCIQKLASKYYSHD